MIISVSTSFTTFIVSASMMLGKVLVEYVNDRLEYKEYVMPGNTGDDLETLISWYVNKTKYKVRYAGIQLRKAFPGLPPVEQRRVGKALLSGPKSDVEWVCKRLDTRKPEWDKDWIVSWHPSYSDLLESAWVKYKSKYCGRLLIQFMGKDVIRKHLDDLLGDDELYFSLCRRLVMEPWFSLDKHRLFWSGITQEHRVINAWGLDTAWSRWTFRPSILTP